MSGQPAEPRRCPKDGCREAGGKGGAAAEALTTGGKNVPPEEGWRRSAPFGDPAMRGFLFDRNRSELAEERLDDPTELVLAHIDDPHLARGVLGGIAGVRRVDHDA